MEKHTDSDAYISCCDECGKQLPDTPGWAQYLSQFRYVSHVCGNCLVRIGEPEDKGAERSVVDEKMR